MALPEPYRRQLSEGRPMAMEVEAEAPGRRSFIEVRPNGGAATLEDALASARRLAQLPQAQSFWVQHVEYDTHALDGYDYDVGRVLKARVEVDSPDDVAATVRSWGYDPGRLVPYFQTDAP